MSGTHSHLHDLGGPVPTDVDVLGIAPGTAVSTERSIDVDVTEGPIGTFTVGARLTPVFGQSQDIPGVDLQPGTGGQFLPTAAQVTLPEPGVYSLTADYLASMTVEQPFGWTIWAWLFDVTAGVEIIDSFRVVHQFIVNELHNPDTGGGAGIQSQIQTAGSTSTFYTVAAPTTIRVEGARFPRITPGGLWQDTTAARLEQVRLGYIKIAD